jgi:hypothetical protein
MAYSPVSFEHMVAIMDCNFVENHPVFVKTSKLNLKFSKIWEFLKYKILRKTRDYSKMLGQNQIQKFKVTHPTKFIEVKNGVKIIKKGNCSVFSKIARFPFPSPLFLASFLLMRFLWSKRWRDKLLWHLLSVSKT